MTKHKRRTTKELPAGCGIREKDSGFSVFKLDPGNPHEGGHVLASHTVEHIAIKEAWKALKSPLRKDLEDLREINGIEDKPVKVK